MRYRGAGALPFGEQIRGDGPQAHAGQHHRTEQRRRLLAVVRDPAREQPLVRAQPALGDDGVEHEVDAIILGTGFEISAPPIAKRVRGRSGQSMADVWQGSPEGYMGTMVADCPNGFLMFGPNLAVSSSAFLIIEAQLTYIIDALKQAQSLKLKTIEVDPARQAAFNDKVQAALQNTVWNKGGCHSYFIDVNGRNSTLWPWSTLEMRKQLSRFNLSEYLVQAGG